MPAVGPALEAIADLVGRTDPSDDDAVSDALFAVSSAMVDAVVLGLDVAPHAVGPATGPVLARGQGVSPGTGSGIVVLNAEDLLDATADGTPCVLWVDQTGPSDEPAIRAAAAVVTTLGGAASHAAIIARQFGVPAVCGVGDVEYPSAAVVCVDGSSGTVVLGGGSTSEPLDELPGPLSVLLGWADDVVGGRVQVAVNAETAEDVHLARAMGAQAVGLCRTEHQFLGARTALVAPLLDGTATDVQLAEFVEVQAAALFDVLMAADGIPVKVRLLDAPAREFLPDAPVGLDGLRGARLALARPAVAEAQAQAVAQAVRQARSLGATVDVSVTVPMVGRVSEFVAVRDLVRAAVATVDPTVDVAVGSMVETPAAAMSAGLLAEQADYLCVGTNDLTALLFGMDRDATSGLPSSVDLPSGLDPFVTLDEDVLAPLLGLVRDFVESSAPGTPLTACGEVIGDAAGGLGYQSMFDEVSASPRRVPSLRLAVAVALLADALAESDEDR